MASGNDIETHKGTYTGFIGMAKWGMIACAVIAAFVVYMISK